MMTPPKDLPRNSIVGGLALALALTTFAPSAQANVYATNIKINGGTTNVSVQAGTNVNISYILNEPASAGVTINILSGATTVRTISVAGGGAGATRGTNALVWDGKDNSSNNVPGGNYSISITAASSGYGGWTVTSDDNNAGNYGWDSYGIAVDRNANSPYYGRVFVGNAYDNSNGGTSTNWGDYVGIQKLNADGSYADEGGFSTGGVAWPGQSLAPRKIRVSDDDKVYIMDVFGYGDVYRFDPVISTNSMLHVLRADNDGFAKLSGIAVVGAGASTQLWMTDQRSLDSAGILKYAVTADGTCATNDTGTTVVGVGGSIDTAPYDVALDKRGNIYCVQNRPIQGDLSPRVFRFPAYDPGTNGGAPITNADWIVPASDDTAGAQGIAVDPTGTYVAACFWGYGSPSIAPIDGNLKIYYATNGTVATNFDLNVPYPNKFTDDPYHHMDTDADWDAVGNLYYLDYWAIVWRAVSPPGANQATTVALPIVTVIGPEQPRITSMGVSTGKVAIHFTGGSNDPAWGFLLLSAPVVTGPYLPAAGAIITGSNGTFQVIVPVNGPKQFYRIERLATIPIHVTDLRIAGGTVTIDFTGSPSDAASAFTLLSSAAANGTYSTAAGANITGSGGTFQATVPTNGPRQFYRIGK